MIVVPLSILVFVVMLSANVDWYVQVEEP